MNIKNNMFFLIYLVILAIFTIYILLNTFVISNVYKNNVSNNTSTLTSTSDNTNSTSSDNTSTDTNTDTDTDTDTNTSSNAENATITDTSYEDENIKINIKKYREYDTNIYVADVVLTDASYLKTAFAKNSYGKNVTAKVSLVANSVNSILAINGDFYGAQEKGYVLKNGEIYRSTSNNNEDLVIYKDGSFEIINEKNTDLSTLLTNGAYNLLSFGPCLLQNNNIMIDKNTEVGKSMASNPRTAIGIIDDLHYVFVVSDGRINNNVGLSLYELATFMKSLNVDIAYNLDGGGSSTMYFNGKVINNPTTSGKKISERSVSDIVYIGY